jgi:hypothetical protein
MSDSQIAQHKRMAMGQNVGHSSSGGKFAKGGSVLLKTGIPDSPITKAKAANGIPGYKAGGSTKMSTSMPRKSSCGC